MADFEIVSGNPSAEELAVVVAVVKAAAATSQQTVKLGGLLRKTTSSWSMNEGMLRHLITPGPGQWRASVRSGLH
ncbi:MAG: acyl-CoA carboxylase epsilon subunit [Micrococcales bacterium]